MELLKRKSQKTEEVNATSGNKQIEIFLEEVALDAVNLIEANPNKEDNPELHRLFMAYMYLYTLALDKGLVRELNNTIHNIKIH